MKGILHKKFNKNQFHYTTDSPGKVYILEPFIDIVGLQPYQAGFLVDSKKGLIQGELYILHPDKSGNFKTQSKANFLKDYPEITEIISIETNLELEINT